VELEDTLHLKRSACGRAGSSPAERTKYTMIDSMRPWLELADTLRSKRSALRGVPVRVRRDAPPLFGSLAQLAEQPALNRQVEGSTPSRSTNIALSTDGCVAQWLEQPAFNRQVEGSRPSAPTTLDWGFV
jgi:hypothetical protein